jgi:hypothetical protein
LAEVKMIAVTRPESGADRIGAIVTYAIAPEMTVHGRITDFIQECPQVLF